MSEDFELHPQLAADSREITRWPLCEVRLINDANYPWLVLVPRLPGLRDLDDLSPEDMNLACTEIRRASTALRQVYRPDKLNVAALGNQVPQLHIHVIARFHGDPAWPGPVWGAVPARPYGEQEDDRVRALESRLRTSGAVTD